MPRSLSPEQVAAYERDGVFFPARVLTDAEVAWFRSRFAAAAAGQEKAQPIRQPHLSLAWAYALATHPAVVDAAEDVLGPEVLLHSTIIFYKRPSDPGYVSWHQDGLYATLRAPRLTSAWIALSDSTVENGCMRVIPGSHRQVAATLAMEKYEDVGQKQSVFSKQIPGHLIDEAKAVDLELEVGEFHFHDVWTIHGSSPNTSDLRRCGYTMRYMSASVLHRPRGNHQIYLLRGQDRTDGQNVYAPVPEY